jgi:antirestriction protein ArdC
VDNAIGDLAEQLERGQSEQLKAYMAAMGRFHRYSLNNAILIVRQCPGATHVAGFRAWKRLGRDVRKGEHGIMILAPVVCRAPQPARESENEDHVDRQANKKEDEEVHAFRPAYVFDVSQTDGRSLPGPAHTRGNPGDLLAQLRNLAAGRGITVQRALRLAGADGLSAGGKIYLRSGLSPAEEFSTLVHEMAHEHLHRDDVGHQSKRSQETEAEAVAYVVCQAVGLDVNTASSDYIQLYDGKKETLMASFARIRSCAADILLALPQARDSPSGSLTLSLRSPGLVT